MLFLCRVIYFSDRNIAKPACVFTRNLLPFILLETHYFYTPITYNILLYFTTTPIIFFPDQNIETLTKKNVER